MFLEAVLQREPGSQQGTPGTLRMGGRFIAFTLELPWRDNQTNVSCIPAGSYFCRPYRSRKFGDVWLLEHVDGRSAILTHRGNWAGAADLGYRTDSWGCILLGLGRGAIAGQRAVLRSRPAMNKMRRFLGRQPFWMEVRDA